MNLKELEADINRFIENGAKNLNQRVFPSWHPYSSWSKNEILSSTFTTGDDGEKRVHEALRGFVMKNEGWFLLLIFWWTINQLVLLLLIVE